MAMLRAGKVEIEKYGTTVTIPNNSHGKLMYYISCVTGLLDMDSDDLENIQKYRDYARHYNMTNADKKAILDLSQILSPSLLKDKIIFESPELCGSSSNEFYKLTRSNLAVAAVDRIVIGGITKRVNKIMTYKYTWIRNYYYEPLEELERELNRVTFYTSSRRRSSSCVVL